MFERDLGTNCFHSIFSNGFANFNPFLRIEDVWDDAYVEDVINVLKKLLIFYLSIAKQERDKFIFESDFFKYLFQILSELIIIVVFGDLKSSGVILCNE